MADIARNDPCPCGSGQKYKRCCLGKEAERAASLRIPGIILAVGLVISAVLYIAKGLDWAGVAAGVTLIVAIGATQVGGPPPPRPDAGSADSINFGN